MRRKLSKKREELFGDKVERVLKKVGADKVAKAYERITKKPCGCQRRKEKLNEYHRLLRKRLQRKT